jgi:hypothetical protein
MQPDDERQAQYWNNEELMLKDGLLRKLTQAKTREDLLEISKKVTIGLWYGDYHSPNDGYPCFMESSQRRRMWYLGEWDKVLRVEMSDACIKQSLLGAPIVQAPKL